MASSGRGDYPVSSAWLNKGSQLIKAVYPGSGDTVKSMVSDWLFEMAQLEAGAGSYTITGSETTLTKGSVISCGAGSITLTGSDAGLVFEGAGSVVLEAEGGTVTITGSDVTFRPGDSVPAGPGSFAVTGSDAGLLLGTKIVCGAGSFTITGSSADLLLGRLLAAGPGSFIVTGSDVAFHRLLQTYLAIGSGLGSSMDAEFLYPIIRRKIPYKAHGKRLSIKIDCNEPGAWMRLIDISNIILPMVGRTRSDRTQVKGTGKHIGIKIESGADPMQLAYLGAQLERYVGQTRSRGVQVKGTGNHVSVKIGASAPIQLAYIGVKVERYMAR